MNSFDELVRARFADPINALCWRRDLAGAGDFREIAHALAPSDGFVDVDVATLGSLELSVEGRRAAGVIIDDMNKLEALGRDPVLNCITRYQRDERGLAIATDLLSFHADRAPVEYDTWLCTYWGKSSEGLDNDDARCRIDVAAVRARLLAEYGGADDEGFAAYVREGAFDLHYEPIDADVADVADVARGAFSFGVGNLWRIAVEWPGSPVQPCLHRAPETLPGDEPRLLLIC